MLDALRALRRGRLLAPLAVEPKLNLSRALRRTAAALEQ
jgi:hypothetical protein